EVCANPLLPVTSVVDDSTIFFPKTRSEIARVCVTPAHIDDAFARDGSMPRQLPLLIVPNALLEIGGCGRSPRSGCLSEGVEGPRAKGIGDLREADALRGVHPSLSRPAPPRCYDHHSVGGSRPVDRRRGRALQHL